MTDEPKTEVILIGLPASDQDWVRDAFLKRGWAAKFMTLDEAEITDKTFKPKPYQREALKMLDFDGLELRVMASMSKSGYGAIVDGHHRARAMEALDRNHRTARMYIAQGDHSVKLSEALKQHLEKHTVAEKQIKKPVNDMTDLRRKVLGPKKARW